MAPPLVPIRSMVLLALCVVSAGRGVVKVPTRAAIPVAIKGDSPAALVAGTQGSTEGMACGIEFEGEDSGSKRKGARASAKGRTGGGGGGGGGGENGKKRSAAGDGGSEKARNAEGNDAKKRKKADEKGLLTLAGRRGRGKRGKGRGGESSKTGQLEIVCKRCRKEKSKNSQNSLMSYFSSSPAKFTTNSDTPTAADTSQGTEKGGGQAGDAGGDSGDDRLICSRCRTSMEEKIPQKGRLPASSIRKGCPTVIKIYNYKRNARNKEVAWLLQDGEAQRMMTSPCFFCGREARLNTDGFNGINRVNHSIPRIEFGNAVPACSECNQMKHNYTVEGFVGICRHIATHNGLGDYGLFPHFFSNNSSPRSPSSYLTKSKTHVLTHEAFKNITAMDCHYCGKSPVTEGPEPRHYNGLDRVDTTVRVYSSASTVASCGTCNTMKWRRTIEEFHENCRRVAEYAARADVTSKAARAVRDVESKGVLTLS